MLKKKNKTQKLFFCVLFILSFSLFLVRVVFIEKITSRALYDFDEARYAEVARNIIRTGNWIIPMAGGPDDYTDIVLTKINNQPLYPYFWKPPLHTIIIAFTYKTFGVSEFSTRLPSLVFTLLNFLLIFKIGQELFRNHVLSWLSVAFFMSLVDVSFLAAQGLAEAVLLFFSLLTIYLIIRNGFLSTMLSGVSLGLAVLVKLSAVYWVIIIAVVFLWFRSKEKNRWQKIILFGLGALVTILPWHMLMYIKFGQVFIEKYLLTNVLGRVTGQTGNIAPIYWYVIHMLDNWKPYVFIFPIILPILLKRNIVRNRVLLLVMMWALMIFIPFSLSTSKVWWYIYPLLVPFVYLISYGLIQIKKYGNLTLMGLVLISGFLALLPFWQLLPSHIPLKEFVVLSLAGFVIGYLLIKLPREKKDVRNIFWLTTIGLVLVANYISIRKELTYKDFNADLKKLASRHKPLYNLAVACRPYEASLFYFESINITRDFSKAKYIITTASCQNRFLRQGWKIIDREGQNVILVNEE